MNLLITSENTAPLKTAGQVQNEINKKDHGAYTHKDLGYATTDGIWQLLIDCIEEHIDNDRMKDIDPDQFCVVMQFVGDPLLANVTRRVFYAWPHLPDPRPEQSVWIYDRRDESVKLLWSLPDAYAMAKLSEELFPHKGYERMKKWCDWWFEGINKGSCLFWDNIRKMHDISMLSECEVLRRNAELNRQLMEKNKPIPDSDTFYLPEIRIKKLETKANSSVLKNFDDVVRKTN